MRTPSSSSFSPIPFLLLLLTFSPSQTSSDDDTTILSEACKKASQGDPNITYEFCLSCFDADPKSENASTIQDLALVSINLAISNITGIRSRIKKLLKQGEFSKDPFARDCLRTCSQLYSDARSNLRLVKRDLAIKDYEKANVDASAAMDDSVTCEDGFGEKEGVVSPLTEENHVFFLLNAVSLAFIVMLP